MLTKDDKKFILKTITFAITENNKILDKKFEEVNNQIKNLVRDTVDLFEATNSAIIKSEERLSEKIDDIKGAIVNHEHRIEKIEDKVFPISA